MIFCFKKKALWIVAAVALIAVLGAGVGVAFALTPSAPRALVVVLDPGHGGIDGGVIGINSKVPESVINLKIALKVKELLEKQNIGVICTRMNNDGLYGEPTDGFKRRDMKKRKEIIRDSNPAAVISIHCNKFPATNRRGAQVFFEPTSDKGIELAQAIQSSFNILNNETVGKEFNALKGDYYILKCSSYPSAIAECGFLSNADDDALLNTDAFQNKAAYAIFSGIISFLSRNDMKAAFSTEVA